MQIKQLYTPKDFEKLDKVLMFDVWYRQALTDKKIAKLFGVTAADVKNKREKLGIRWMSSAMASLSGGKTFTSKKKLIEIHPPKDWNGEPIKFEPDGYRSRSSSGYKVTNLEAEGNALDPKQTDNTNSVSDKMSNKPVEVDKFSAEDAANAWKKAKEHEASEKDSSVNIDEQLVINGVEVNIKTADSENIADDEND